MPRSGCGGLGVGSGHSIQSRVMELLEEALREDDVEKALAKFAAAWLIARVRRVLGQERENK